jgi:hypothetical protein
VVGGTGHGHNDESLDEDAERKGIHGEAGCIDFRAQYLHHALAFVALGGAGEELRGTLHHADGCFGRTWSFVVFEQHTYFTRELFECDGDEGAYVSLAEL